MRVVNPQHDAAEGSPCGLVRLVRGHASTPVIGLERREMRGGLAGKLALRSVGLNGVDQTEQESAHGRLLVPQGGQRIDPRRAPRGQVTGRQTDDSKKPGGTGEDRRIERRHAKQEGHERARGAGGK